MKTSLTSPCYAALGCALVVAHTFLVGIPVLRTGHAVWARWPMIDDAFYYLQPAWNLAHGRGLTLDGMSPTNGFHPLWMFIVSATALLAPSKTVFFDAVRILSLILFYAATVSFAWLSLAVFHTRTILPVAIAIYFAIPQLFLAHMNGLETGLALLLSTLVLQTLVSRDRIASESPVAAARMGILAGLLFLTRTDAVVIVVLVGILWLLPSARAWIGNPRSLPGALRVLQDTGLLILPCVVLAVPWFIWCLVEFGRVVQTSAYTDPIIVRRFLTTHFDFAQTGWHHFFLGRAWHDFSYVLSSSNVGLPVPAFAAAVASAFLVACFTPTAGIGRRFLAVWMVLLGSLMALILIHVGVRLTPFNGWYYYPSQLLLLIVLLLFLYMLVHARRNWVRCTAGAALVICGILLAGSSARAYSTLWSRKETRDRPGTRRQELFRYPEGGELPPDSAVVVGATDSGALSFFAPGNVAVVNLDGLINEAAARGIREGRLADYILSVPMSHIQVRAPLCLLESIMGCGFRGCFLTRSITDVDWLAEPTRTRPARRVFLSLPPDGVIRPATTAGWKHLVGEWRGLTGQGKAGRCRVAVKDFGVRFATDGSPAATCLVAAASPYPGTPLSFRVSLDGHPIGEVRCRSGPTAVRWWEKNPSLAFDDGRIVVDTLDTLRVNLGRLSAGTHDVVLHVQESLSPYLLGRGDDHAIYSCLVAEFRIVE